MRTANSSSATNTADLALERSPTFDTPIHIQTQPGGLPSKNFPIETTLAQHGGRLQ
jgi:hypothetical protein